MHWLYLENTNCVVFLSGYRIVWTPWKLYTNIQNHEKCFNHTKLSNGWMEQGKLYSKSVWECSLSVWAALIHWIYRNEPYEQIPHSNPEKVQQSKELSFEKHTNSWQNQPQGSWNNNKNRFHPIMFLFWYIAAALFFSSPAVKKHLCSPPPPRQKCTLLSFFT